MIKLKYFLTLFLLGYSLLAQPNPIDISVVPNPAYVRSGKGVFEFNSDTKWVVESESQKEILLPLLNRFRIAANFQFIPDSVQAGLGNKVVFKSNKALPAEAYNLSINKESIILEASGESGFYYGITTLMQLLPSDIFSHQLISDVNWQVPCLKIEDTPRFEYRGFMLDVSRYFMPKEDLLDIIDYLALHKINYLHLHLVDDNGWRLEIKKYPELTDIGAWRADRYNYFSARQNPVEGEPKTVGGFYSQEDIKEIVSYAAHRQIEVVPEIEMPAHTISSLAALPHLTCPVVEEPVNVLPGIGGSQSSVIYCAGNDSVFTFLEDVIDEVIEMFPSEYIHIGGDEAWKDNWEKCPRCQATIKEEGLHDEEELQAWFVNKMSNYIRQNGKKVMGWDELTNGEIPEGATIFGWRGMGEHALKAADQGHPFIMTPARALYFIRYQGPQWFEPFTYFGDNTLRDVYEYEPSGEMTGAQYQYLKGIQACLWSEFVSSPEEAQYLVFPRLAAFSEIAWSPEDAKDWKGFLTRLDHLTGIYEKKGIGYSKYSMFNLYHTVSPQDGDLKVELSCIRPDVEIRYNIGHARPTGESQLYQGPFTIREGQVVSAATFQNGKLKGRVLRLNPRFNKATGHKVVSSEPNSNVITNGLLGSEKMTDGEYVDLYDCGGEFVIDLEQIQSFKKVGLSFLNNYGRSVHLPSSATIFVSKNGNIYQEVASRELAFRERISEGIKHHVLWFNFNETDGRFLKIKLGATGIMPDGHVLEHKPGRIAFDEVFVE
ncbi:beta-N-acetylhexosaminidase [Marinilabilia rubra]|uniref:beta-N-acetylhexosaminidase n=1 Tax=Marinilabilia rubra TaxID=2162893 RepID=A0A2U2BBD4_9BACT|nr:family 20 glycosylhydrolase [Marinilabilia rubra]PWE00369.1 beta-hexosaminidase [Marinilabilia rubra]